MKAAVVEKPGVLKVRDIPIPEIGEYDALCKLLYGATCTGTDQHVIAGRFPWPVRYPTVLGHESVGTVIKTGKKVRNFKVGDLITRVGTLPSSEFDINWGGFCEFGVARDHKAMREDGISKEEWDRFRVNQTVPEGIEPQTATMIITWRETLSYITRMGVGAGSSLLVVGSGANGLAFAAHAKNLGVKHVVVIGNISRENTAKEVGATDYFNYKTENLVNLICEKYAEGFDYIIDAIGKAGEMNKVLPLLKSGGKIGIYGLDDYSTNSIFPNNARGTFTYYNGGYDEEETHEMVINFIQKGLLKAEYWIDTKNVYSLSEIDKAYEALKEKKLIKALIKLSND